MVVQAKHILAKRSVLLGSVRKLLFNLSAVEKG